MGFLKCACLLNLFVNLIFKENKNLEPQESLIVDQRGTCQNFFEDRESDPLSPMKIESINRWRRKIQTESPSVQNLISAIDENPIVDELYNEQVWKWFDRNFYKNVKNDFKDSETIYLSPQSFIDQLARNNKSKLSIK